MVSVIVFSKGRPMQLHAYLESLLLYSEVQQEMITVLYCEMDGICYDKVMKEYPNVHWIRERRFEEDLKAVVSQAAPYIMFGCDDVVFTRSFSIKRACDYLDAHENVFGFSMRLGENITPHPAQNLSDEPGIFEWKWEGCTENRYNYPWELDCTVYRKADVVRLTEEEEQPIKNPNYYEAMINPDNISRRITRKHLASYREYGCAVVITVNRVQDTHPNGYDDSMRTDIYTLDRLYNEQNNTLDIEKISGLKTNQIHVESEFFILRKPVKGYSKGRMWKKRARALWQKAMRLPIRLHRHLDRQRYRKGAYCRQLDVLNPKETVQILEQKAVSLIRYGEGEISLIRGEGIPFQSYDEKLAGRLKELLRTQEEGLCIGIPYYFLHPVKNLTPYAMQRALAVAVQRSVLLRGCNRNTQYLDACVMNAYQTYAKYDFKSHYNQMQALLSGRDVTVVCGEEILDRLQYKALDVCKSAVYVYGPAMNAYSEYDALLDKVLKTDKNRLVLVAMGPTAKALVYDLYKAGYQAWDMGHYFKDYDAYMRRKPRTAAEIAQFYKPD